MYIWKSKKRYREKLFLFRFLTRNSIFHHQCYPQSISSIVPLEIFIFQAKDFLHDCKHKLLRCTTVSRHIFFDLLWCPFIYGKCMSTKQHTQASSCSIDKFCIGLIACSEEQFFQSHRCDRVLLYHLFKKIRQLYHSSKLIVPRWFLLRLKYHSRYHDVSLTVYQSISQLTYSRIDS